MRKLDPREVPRGGSALLACSPSEPVTLGKLVLLGGGGLYLCVFTLAALLACSGTFLAPHCLWSRAFRAGRDPAISAVSFTPFMTMGLSSAKLNSKHEVKVLEAQSCPTLCNPMNCKAY